MDEHLLDDRHLLQRDLHAQVAAGHHDAVAHAQDLVDVLHALHVFDLGDDGHIGAAQGAEELAHVQNVLRTAGEGGGDEVHAVLDAEGDVLAVLGAEVRHAEVHVGDVDALSVGDDAVVVDDADDLAGGEAAHGHAHQAVIDEDGGAFLDIARQVGVGDGGALGVAHHALGKQSKGLALLELDLSVFKRFQTDFRTLGIQHDGDGQVQLPPERLDAADVVQMRFVRSMRKVEPGYVHARQNQFAEDGVVLGGGAERAYDLGLAVDHCDHPFRDCSISSSFLLISSPPA